MEKWGNEEMGRKSSLNLYIRLQQPCLTGRKQDPLVVNQNVLDPIDVVSQCKQLCQWSRPGEPVQFSCVHAILRWEMWVQGGNYKRGMGNEEMGNGEMRKWRNAQEIVVKSVHQIRYFDRLSGAIILMSQSGTISYLHYTSLSSASVYQLHRHVHSCFFNVKKREGLVHEVTWWRQKVREGIMSMGRERRYNEHGQGVL